MIDSKVLLPQPEAPTSETNSLSATSRFMSASALIVDRLAEKDLCRCEMLSFGCGCLSGFSFVFEELPAEEAHDLVGRQAEHAEHQDVADRHVGLQVALGDRDPETKARICGDELGQRHPGPGPAERDAQRVP